MYLLAVCTLSENCLLGTFDYISNIYLSECQNYKKKSGERSCANRFIQAEKLLAVLLYEWQWPTYLGHLPLLSPGRPEVIQPGHKLVSVLDASRTDSSFMFNAITSEPPAHFLSGKVASCN